MCRAMLESPTRGRAPVEPDSVDVLVVGAGPVGSNTARLLALGGHRVLMVEEHPEVGVPVQCAGLVTPRLFEHTPFPIGDLWQNDLHGAKVVSPNGTELLFETEAVQAQAMDRARFDQRMAQHAQEAGVEVRTSTKAVAATRQGGRIIVTLQNDGKRQDVACRLLVGADGIRGNVARWFGFPPVAERVSAYEVELTGCHLPDGPRIIPMFAGRAQAPGFFSWIIPVGGDRTRSGLAVAPGMNESAAKAYYERMFEDPHSAHYLAGSQESYRIIGGIPLGLRKRLVDDGVALVGDAAGMAKPTSGGGIYMGLVASEHLAEVAGAALHRGDVGKKALRPYEKRVRQGIAKELRKGDRLRSIYKRLDDRDLDRLGVLCNGPRVRAAIERHGDIDYPSRLVVPLLVAEPRLAGLFAKAMIRRRR